MTITGTANVVNNGYFSSLIRNIGTADAASSLTVSGNATLRQDNFIALKNDDYGNVAVTGGTITSNEQTIQNWSQAAISGEMCIRDSPLYCYTETEKVRIIFLIK